MPTIVVRHKVGNFDTWLQGHQDRVELFSQFASGFKTFRDTDDPNAVVIVAEVHDLGKMQEVMSNTDIMDKIARQKHTVQDPITVSMPVEI